MEKYKICPICHTRNEPMRLECVNCEADLTRVTITDDQNEKTEKKLTENQSVSEQESIRSVRICSCGMHNPANARKCQSCHEDISDIMPVSESKESIDTFILSSLDGAYAYRISVDEIIIGRDHEMCEYLSVKKYVSRVHARLSVEANELYIENLSNTNYTYINNHRINEKVKLAVGDEIGLGGTNIDGICQPEAAYFVVRTKSCISQESCIR